MNDKNTSGDGGLRPTFLRGGGSGAPTETPAGTRPEASKVSEGPTDLRAGLRSLVEATEPYVDGAFPGEMLTGAAAHDYDVFCQARAVARAVLDGDTSVDGFYWRWVAVGDLALTLRGDADAAHRLRIEHFPALKAGAVFADLPAPASAFAEFTEWCREPRRDWSLTPMATGFELSVSEPGAHTSWLRSRFAGDTPDEAAERAFRMLRRDLPVRVSARREPNGAKASPALNPSNPSLKDPTHA